MKIICRKKVLLIFMIFLFKLNLFSQKNKYSIGSDLSFWSNKINSGILFTIVKPEKQEHTRPIWIFQFNYGIYGTKRIKQNEPDTIGGGLLFPNSKNFPYDIPPNGPTTFGYYTKEHYIKNIGWSIAVAKEFKISNPFIFGVGIGVTHIKDMGYLIWVNPFTNDIIRKNIDIDASTVFFMSNIGYHYDFNTKWFISAFFNLYFHAPIQQRSKDDNRYELNSPSLPTIGNEQDLSLSINYKF